MQQIETAVQLLNKDKLVAFPTETVYGLGANALSVPAVKKVYEVKQRPTDRPLIVHIASYMDIVNWASDIPDYVIDLAKQVWPGPVTFILPKAKHIPDIVTGGLDTIALRVPNHNITLELLKKFGGGVVGPSANSYGSISPTSYDDVKLELGDKVDFILDGGRCSIGIESTIIKATNKKLIVMRQGMLDLDLIPTHIPIELISKNYAQVPGNALKHYAPKSSATLLDYESIKSKVYNSNAKVAVIAIGEKVKNSNLVWFAMPNNPASYAHLLYSTLRKADRLMPSEILIETPPLTKEWQAILDRVKRATY